MSRGNRILIASAILFRDEACAQRTPLLLLPDLHWLLAETLGAVLVLIYAYENSTYILRRTYMKGITSSTLSLD